MLVVQSILLCIGIDSFKYLKSIIDRYLCNGDLEVNNIMYIKIIIINDSFS